MIIRYLVADKVFAFLPRRSITEHAQHPMRLFPTICPKPAIGGIVFKLPTPSLRNTQIE